MIRSQPFISTDEVFNGLKFDFFDNLEATVLKKRVEPDPDLFFSGTDPIIRIHIKR
jgi:hypothetical protein